MVKTFLQKLNNDTAQSTRWLKFYALVQFLLTALLLMGAVAALIGQTAEIIRNDAFAAQVGRFTLLAACIILDLVVLLYLVFAWYATLLLAKSGEKLNIFYLWLVVAAVGFNTALLQPWSTDSFMNLSIGLGTSGVFVLLWLLPNRKYLLKRAGLFTYEMQWDRPAAEPAPQRQPMSLKTTPKAPAPPKKLKKAAPHEKPRAALEEDKQIKYEYAPNTMISSPEMLKKLFEKGLITETEYNTKKKEYEQQNKKNNIGWK